MKFSTAIVCAVALAAMSANAAPIQSAMEGLGSDVQVTSSSDSHHHRHSTGASSLSSQTNGASGSRIHYGSIDNRQQQQQQAGLNNGNLNMGGLNALLGSGESDNTMQYPNGDLQGVVPQPEQLRQSNNEQYAAAIKAQTSSLNLNAAQASTVSQVLQRLTGSGSQAVETGGARSRHHSSATSSSKKHHKHHPSSALSSSSKHRKSKHHKSKQHKSSSSASSATDSSSSSADASATPTDASSAAPDATPTDAAPDAPADAAAAPMAADPAAAADPPPPSDSDAPPPQKRSVDGENASAAAESLRRCRRPLSLSGSRSASRSARPTNSRAAKHGHLNGQSSTGDVEMMQAFGYDGTHSMSSGVNVGGSGASSVDSASRSRPQGAHTRLNAAAQSSSAAPSSDVGAGLWGLIFGN